MIKNPIISTIIPIYNVEDYIKETLESVISQSIGFLDNIELVLIDDGSSDDSGLICKRYQSKYPENIRYIKQKNSGVSVARNNGFKYAKGKYVHFLDSDDIISKHAYRETIGFLERNAREIDMATMRLEFFEAALGGHPLNDKFNNGNRIIDIHLEPSSLILHSAATIFLRKAFVSKYDPTIKISEDMKLLTEQLSRNGKYGAVATATYFYRRRKNGVSAITGSQRNKTFYTVTPHKVYEYILGLFPQTQSGYPDRYVQYAVMYDLQWRLRQVTQSVLSDEEERSYKTTIFGILKKIEDDVIITQKNMSDSAKLFALSKKWGSVREIPQDTLRILQKQIDSHTPVVIVEFITPNKNTVKIEGRVPDGSDLSKISLMINDKKLVLKRLDVKARQQTFLGEIQYDGFVFSASIKKHQIKHGARIVAMNNGSLVQIITKRQSRIPLGHGAYAIINGKIWRREKGALCIYDISSIRLIRYELVRSLRILASMRLQWSAKRLRVLLESKLKQKIPLSEYTKVIAVPAGDLLRNIRDISLRTIFFLTRKKKEVWIISDRFAAAGDNGEALFRHVMYKEHPKAEIYFAIDARATDFLRLRNEFGKRIIDSTSLRYKLLFLNASKIISSHADDFVVNPFDWRVKNFYDLFKFDFIFLQHGIARNDMSRWLNRYNKNIQLFVTSSEREYKSILEYDYGYDKERVLLSGLPRYDLLKNHEKRKIIIAPTWRMDLTGAVVNTSGDRAYNPDFKQSEYYRFYNGLLNSRKLIDSMEREGIRGEFYIHPSHRVQNADFKSNDRFEIMSFPYDYKRAFSEGSLLVTDYSSVFFDFTYLRKPVILSQFDRAEWYEGHLFDEGYFDDTKEGFGPVTRTLDETVDEIIKLIDNNFQLEVKYKKRIDSFFEFNDKNSSKRVYKAILQHDKAKIR